MTLELRLPQNITQKMTEELIPQQTVEAFARNFFKQASEYGFGQLDYIRFVNQLLDISMKNTVSVRSRVNGATDQVRRPDTLHEQVSLELPIDGKHVRIRAYQPTDSDRNLIKSWLSDRHGRHFLLSRTTSKTVAFDELADNGSNIFGLITEHDNTPIGSVAFLDYDAKQRKAELRKLIGEPDMRGKGLAKEATRLWIRYGIEALALKKVYLNTLNTNIKNIKLNEELGFEFEGILRNEVFFDGQYHDVLRMGMWVD